MTGSAVVRELSRYARSLRRDQRGASAVEFAMLLPLMVTLYLGAVEISQAVGINRKVTLTARTVADLASQVSSINNSDMTNLLKASVAVMAPYCISAGTAISCTTGELKAVTVTAVSIDKDGVAKVVWSDSLNGTKRAVGSTVTVPAALNVPNSQLIWGEVAFRYVPTIGYVVTGSRNLADQIYMRPRLSDTVARVNS